MKPHLRFTRARSPSLYPTTTSILIRYRTESTENTTEKLLKFQPALCGVLRDSPIVRCMYFTLQKLAASLKSPLVRPSTVADSRPAAPASSPPAPPRPAPVRPCSPLFPRTFRRRTPTLGSHE